MDGTDGTGGNTLRIGDETAADVTIYAQNDQVTKPFVRYDESDSKWLISNDGVSTYDIASGGSGLTRGLGVDIQTSAITLDVRSSGGLRNNQGTGSQQCDVDPAIVARLDTANTWGAAQSLTAAQLLITTDPATGNEGVRSSYLDAQLTAEVPKGAVQGTSGEAITAGDGVYLKASDGKLWKTDSDADESTFSFVGIAITTVGAADLAVEYAPPGHVVSGLAGLTAGSPYYVTGTAGTLTTTPGTRYALVGRAISTTQMQVLEPEFKASGSFTVSASGNTTLTFGFRAKILHLMASVTVDGDTVGASSMAQNALENRCMTIWGVTGANGGGDMRSGLCMNLHTSSGVHHRATISATSNTGATFTNTKTGSPANATIYWTAFS
jgi:hypothetical protein